MTEAQQERRDASRALLEAVAELGESLWDDALELAEDEREASFFASATLLSALERERVLRRPARVR